MMRFAAYIFMLAFCLLSGTNTTQAQTAISDKQAQNFYYNCMAKRDKRMRVETQDMMCLCRSTHIQKSMSVEAVQSLGDERKRSLKEHSKLIFEVYVPCMNEPLQDMVGIDCLYDEKVDQIKSKKPKDSICQCVAEKTAEWFETEGISVMRMIVLEHQDLEDPFEPFLKNKALRSARYDALLTCLKEVK